MSVWPIPALILLCCCCSGLWAIGADCPIVTLTHGSVLRLRRRFIRFRCDTGFEMQGDRYMQCTRGKWDGTLPMCLKSGCPSLATPADGVLTLSGRRTSVTLNCNPGHAVAGAQTAYCDGVAWDRALGNCRAHSVGPAAWCDFEVDTCGWTPDADHNYSWKRLDGVPKSHLRSRASSILWRTGPTHDHTIGVPLEGHYMVAMTGDQLAGDSARLVSPLYAAEQSVAACFRFYYHMYGRGVGSLRVQLKGKHAGGWLEDWAQDAIVPDSRAEVLFELKGSQKNEWHVAIVQLTEQAEEFQLVVQANAGASAFSEIAIDDVALLQGADCRNEEDTIDAATTPAEELGGVYDVAVCAGRCGQMRSAASDNATLDDQQGGVTLNCDCDDECADRSACCTDYFRVCLVDGTQTDPSTSTTMSTTRITTPKTTTTTRIIPKTTPSTTSTSTTTRITMTSSSASSTTTSTTATTTSTPPTRSTSLPFKLTTPKLKPTLIPVKPSTLSTILPPTSTPKTAPTTAPTPPAKVSLPPTQIAASNAPKTQTKPAITDHVVDTTALDKANNNSNAKNVWRPDGSHEFTPTKRNGRYISIVWCLIAGLIVSICVVALTARQHIVPLYRTIKQRISNDAGDSSEVRYLVEDDGQLDFVDGQPKKKVYNQCEL